MSTNLSRFQDAFFEESSEHLSTIEEGLLQLEQHPQDLDLLNRIFRAAHSIKGNSGMFGFTAVGQFTHKMETLLDQLRNGQMAVTGPLIDILLRATDCLKSLLEAARTGAPVDEETFGRLGAELEASQSPGQANAGTGTGGDCPPPQGTVPLLGRSQSPTPSERGQSPAPLAHNCRYTIAWTPPPWLFQRGLDPIQMLKELGDLGRLMSVTVDTSRLPNLSEMDPEQCYLSWAVEVETSKDRAVVEGVFDFVREDSVLTIEKVEVKAEVKEDSQGSSSTLASTSASTCEAREPKPLGEILVETGVVTQDTLNNALAQQKRVGEILIEQKAVTPQQIAQALEKQRQLESAAHAKKADTASIRVDTAKIDKLINLAGELVITQSMLSALGKGFDMSKLPVLLERTAQLERNTREIQERVMGIRMLPIGQVFSRFPRLVRDLAAKNGKKIRFVMNGEETELDKTVIESIGDPLTHLVRNSADHGLEPPDERVAAGKPDQGVIKMNAYHEGGNICITVEDDGRGLNREKILAKAVKQGLISETDKLSDEQMWSLIFRPGFSTADKVTDVSGRGVGMDVVKRNIESLGGTVSIRTAAGKGTTFTLKLPLTLAIVEGMTVRVGQESYIIPLVSILESVKPTPDAIQTVLGKGDVVNVRGAHLPIIRLAETFSIEAEDDDSAGAILVIIETESGRVAVMVDELLGQQQVVIKSLERNFRKVEGIAGATILGDGTVAFILDVRGLIELARRGEAVAA